VTSFFVPGATPGKATRQAYDDLRGYVESRTGRMTRGDVIFALSCRRAGEDSEARVGELDPYSREIVLAIFASREWYTIVWNGGHADVSRRQAYEAIPFDPAS
jgi:hypothetical protein